MTSTPAAKPRRRKPAYGAIMMGVCGVILVGFLAGLWVWHQRAQIEEAQAWAPPGPACQIVSRQAYLAIGAPEPHVSTYDGVRFARAYGAVGCNEIASHGGRGPGRIPVCQFNSPTTLEVSTPRGDTYYFTQAKPAVVTISDGQPACALSAGEGMP